MAKAKRFLYLVVGIVIVIGILFVAINNYSFLFSRHVNGEIVGVERVTPPVAIVGSQEMQTAGGLFSFAVAIRDEAGVIHTASSEDRQWAIARPGFCADAVFYPYPFWNLEKRGTYMNARLIQLRDCASKSPVAPGAQAVPQVPAGAPGAEGVGTPSSVATPPTFVPSAGTH